jgi:hypothetical protein
MTNVDRMTKNKIRADFIIKLPLKNPLIIIKKISPNAQEAPQPHM